jgi:hypothetical protein
VERMRAYARKDGDAALIAFRAARRFRSEATD